MTKYGILDDDGQVIRWVWDRPADHYQFIVVKVRRERNKKIDLSQFEEATF